MADTPQTTQWNALKKIVKRLPAHLAYYGSALGAIAIAGSGAEGMVSIVGNIGAGLLGNLIADIAKGEDVIDEDIRHRAEDAIDKSDIANLLTKQDFLQGYARLIQRLDAQKTISQDILDELRTGFSKVATTDQVEELKRLILQLMQQPPQTATRKVRLFISYARADDEPFVERLYHDLKDEFDVWWDRVSMPNRGLTFLQEIRDAIHWADRLLLVAGPCAFTSDYVRDEWQHAYETYKGINIALRLGDYTNFPAQLSGFDAPDFRRDDDYDERLATLKRQLAQPVAPVGKFHGVPALPPHFLNRPDALDALRELVIADVDKPTLISAENRTTTVEGMGGIGKSVIATAFAHDRKVRFAFPNGIIWLTVGREPRMYELYRAVGVALGDNLSNYPDETTARQNAQRILAEKKCLLILDDVWELPVGRAFRDLISGTAARLLITTRNLQINNMLDANEYRLTLINAASAVEYLRSWVGDDPKLGEVSRALGYLFLALNLAGRLMKENNLSGSQYLNMFNHLSDMTTGENRQDSLEFSITLGIDAAFSRQVDKSLLYYALGIFSEDAEIPQPTILQLWAQMYPSIRPIDHLKTMTKLVNLGLMERDGQNIITLHDLLHKYVRDRLGARCVQTHQDLLDSYQATQQRQCWNEIHDDGYLYDHLFFHLDAVDNYEEMRTLFLTDRWLRVRLKQSNFSLNGYLSDLSIVSKKLQEKSSRDMNEVLIVDSFRYCIIRSTAFSFGKRYTPIAFRLCIETGIWTPELAWSIISRLEDDKEKIEASRQLLMVANISQELRSFIEETILDLMTQEDHETSSSMVGWIMPHLSNDTREQIRSIFPAKRADSEAESGGMPADGDYLAMPPLELSDMLALENGWTKARIILENFLGKSEDAFEAFLASVYAIHNHWIRAELLTDSMQILDTFQKEKVMALALAECRALAEPWPRFDRLTALLPIVDAEARNTIVREACALIPLLNDMSVMAMSILRLSSYLSSEIKAQLAWAYIDMFPPFDDMAEVAKSMGHMLISARDKLDNYTELISLLTKQIRLIPRVVERAETIVANRMLLPHESYTELLQDLFNDLLRQKQKSPEDVIKALKLLAGHLPEELQSNLVNMINTLQDETAHKRLHAILDSENVTQQDGTNWQKQLGDILGRKVEKPSLEDIEQVGDALSREWIFSLAHTDIVSPSAAAEFADQMQYWIPKLRIYQDIVQDRPEYRRKLEQSMVTYFSCQNHERSVVLDSILEAKLFRTGLLSDSTHVEATQALFDIVSKWNWIPGQKNDGQESMLKSIDLPTSKTSFPIISPQQGVIYPNAIENNAQLRQYFKQRLGSSYNKIAFIQMDRETYLSLLHGKYALLAAMISLAEGASNDILLSSVGDKMNSVVLTFHIETPYVGREAVAFISANMTNMIHNLWLNEMVVLSRQMQGVHQHWINQGKQTHLDSDSLHPIRKKARRRTRRKQE